MIPVSDQWKTDIQKQFRNMGFLRMSVEVVPPGVREGATLADVAGVVSGSQQDNILSGSHDSPIAYASTELNRWLLNGKYEILNTANDDTTSDTWVNPPTETAPILLSFTLDKAYTLPGIFIEWDLVNGTSPSKITIEGVAGSTTYSKTFDNLREPKQYFDLPMDNVTSVTIKILSNNVSGWYTRICQVTFGYVKQYTSENGGRILSGTLTDSACLDNKKLPRHSLKTELRNYDKEFDPLAESGIAKYLSRRQKVTYKVGFTRSDKTVEWTPDMVYYVSDFSIPSDTKVASISSGSRLDFLTQNFKFDSYTGEARTLQSLATAVLNGSNVIKDSDDQIPWTLDASLANFSTTAYIPKVASNVALQLIAGATNCWLGTNPTTGFIEILQHTGTTPVYSLTKGQELGDPKVQPSKALHSVAVNVYAYTLESSTKVLSEGSYLLSGETTLTLDYNVDAARSVAKTVTGGTVSSFTAYATCAVITVTPTSTATPVAIKLEGKEVKKSSTKIVGYENAAVVGGVDILVDNPFVTSTDYVTTIATKIVSLYSDKANVKLQYLGYPDVCAGDLVGVTTDYGESGNVRVTSNTVKFNGGFTGTMEVT